MTTETLRQLVLELARTDDAVVQGVGLDPREIRKLRAPDTAAVRRTEQVAVEACTRSLLNHSVRSFAWGALLGLSESRQFDAEVFYVAALMHDIGLMPAYDRGGCFEVDGGDAARELLREVGWSGERADIAGDAVRDHWHGPEGEDHVEALLLAYGTSVDVSGWRTPEFDDRVRAAVVAAFPRENFKRHFVDLIADQAARKPHCTAAEAWQRGFAQRVLDAPFDE
jgi:hypothetical protein